MTTNHKQMLDVKEILKYLPHRYPFLLVDRIVEIHGEDKIVGIKNVSFNEPFFQGHFPARPVMPGVLICEAMAQVGAIFAPQAVCPITKTTLAPANLQANSRLPKMSSF